MSNNVNTIRILDSDGFGIGAKALIELSERYGRDSPEISIFDQRWRGMQRIETAVDQERIFPRFLWWSGEGSGSTLDVLTYHILPAFSGQADLLVIYESGGLEGLRLFRGNITRRKVIVELGDEL